MKMLQAKHRKVLWVLLLLWMLYLQKWFFDRFIYMDISIYVRMGFYTVRPLLLVIWLLGVLVMGIRQLASYQHFRKKALERMYPVQASWMQSACQQAAEEAGCTDVPPLYQSSAVSTPLVLGFAAPVMLVPEQEYTWAELHMVFLHECTHVRKKDLWYKLLFAAGTCLLWFQPLFYLLKAAAFRDVEVACDQSVIEGKAEADRRAYADFLLESLRKGKRKELPYSAYFYNSKAVMKARLAVIEDTRERSGIPGAAVCLILSAVTVVMAADYVNEWRQRAQAEYEASQPQNIYEGYGLPDNFTEESGQQMIEIIAQSQGAQPMDAADEEASGAANGEDIRSSSQAAGEEEARDAGASGPWQVENAQSTNQAALALAYRFVMYFGDQELGSRMNSNLAEDVDWLWIDGKEMALLGENEKEAVCAVRFRYLTMDKDDVPEVRALPGVQRGYDDGTEYLYVEWAVRISKTGNISELTGIAELEKVLAGCEAAGIPADTGFQELDLWNQPVCRARTRDGMTEATWDDGETWKEVPIELEALTARGDQLDGALTGVQEKSYVVSEEMTAFAYGGSPEVPVTVTWSKDQGETWMTSVVTYEYPDVRRLFLSFPDAEHGFLVLTAGRDMRQEGDILYRTENGGVTWTKVERETAPGAGGSHSLLTGAEFMTPEVGFISIQSSQRPLLYRTEDGGVNWKLCALPGSDAENAEYYTMAYVPEQKEDHLCVYLSMAEYSEMGGVKLRYESQDLGATWNYTGEVLRK